jgi:hypothetical protein
MLLLSVTLDELSIALEELLPVVPLELESPPDEPLSPCPSLEEDKASAELELSTELEPPLDELLPPCSSLEDETSTEPELRTSDELLLPCSSLEDEISAEFELESEELLNTSLEELSVPLEELEPPAPGGGLGISKSGVQERVTITANIRV